MTDKIIIDGVDISGCGYYDPYMSNGDCIIQGFGINDSILYCDCKDNPNCHYKQLQRKEQKCEELKGYKKKVDYLHSFLINKYNYGSFKPMWGAYLLKHLFNEDLGNFFDKKAYEMADTIEKKEKENDSYKQALERIEKTATDLRTRRDYHSPDEVNADIDKILTIVGEVLKDE